MYDHTPKKHALRLRVKSVALKLDENTQHEQWSRRPHQPLKSPENVVELLRMRKPSLPLLKKIDQTSMGLKIGVSKNATLW